jgi:hypothetical protein
MDEHQWSYGLWGCRAAAKVSLNMCVRHPLLQYYEVINVWSSGVSLLDIEWW